MIGCLQTRVRKQPIIALYFEFETVIKFYNLRARADIRVENVCKYYQQMMKLLQKHFLNIIIMDCIFIVRIGILMSAHVLLNILNKLGKK